MQEIPRDELQSVDRILAGRMPYRRASVEAERVGRHPDARFIPIGCDQQGRIPEAAEQWSEISIPEDEDEHRSADMLGGLLVAVAIFCALGGLWLIVSAGEGTP